MNVDKMIRIVERGDPVKWKQSLHVRRAIGESLVRFFAALAVYNERQESEYAAWVRAVRALDPYAPSYAIPRHLLVQSAETTWEMPTDEDLAAHDWVAQLS